MTWAFLKPFPPDRDPVRAWVHMGLLGPEPTLSPLYGWVSKASRPCGNDSGG